MLSEEIIDSVGSIEGEISKSKEKFNDKQNAKISQ